MGRPAINLLGKKFNRLTVIARYRDGTDKTVRNAYWKCQCDCGNTTIVKSGALQAGDIKSCGCYNREQTSKLGKSWFKDLTGQKFGRLTIISQDRDKRGNIIWICKCDCGNITRNYGDVLKRGNVVSCGCYLKEMIGSINTTHGKSRTPEYNRAKAAKYRALKRNLDTDWNYDMDILLRECCNYQCVVCGMTQEEHLKEYGEVLHVDHVYPISLGGGLRPGNVVLLCEKCNRKKSKKLLTNLPYRIGNIIITAATTFDMCYRAFINNRDVNMWKYKNIPKRNIDEIWRKD